MNTILSQKNNILAAFNAVVPQQLAQTLFEQRITLWESAETPYNTQAQFVGIFSNYAPFINMICNAYNTVDGVQPATRKAEYKHNKGTTETSTRKGTDTYTNGEQSENNKTYVYPQGFTGDSDHSYLATEADNIQDEVTNTTEYDTTDTRTNSGADTDTESVFELSVFLSQGGELATQLLNYINACIFDIMPISISGGAKQWH